MPRHTATPLIDCPRRRQVLGAAASLLAVGFVRPSARQSDRVTVRDARERGVEIRDQGQPVLRYRYATVPVPAALRAGLSEREAESMRRYGHPRSNYIHPLHGLDGVPLTADWVTDHPHHRGIYWAWPEVGYKGELGDLHALQRVFARPTSQITWQSGNRAGWVEAVNDWRWDDLTPIVRETARIEVSPRGTHGRTVDLRFTFAGLIDGVTLARRETKLYGGLNVRLAPVANLQLAHHADPPSASPRMAWQTASGTWQGSDTPSSLTIVEAADNPDYPGDYVQFPDLPWFQPTFPRAGTRFELVPGTPLVLRYRLWIRQGAMPTDAEYRSQWRAFQDHR